MTAKAPATAPARGRKTSSPSNTVASACWVIQRRCACGGTPGPDGECAECRRKRLGLQGRAPGTAEPSPGLPGDPIPRSVQDVVRREGAPLAAPLRRTMEDRFGHDFGQVRVHTDARAAASASAVNALAYTVGRDIVFAEGRYAPGTASGRRLLAHELAHVVQQRSGAFPADGGVVADGRWEAEAEATADAVLANRPVRVLGRAAQPQLARQQARAAGEKVRVAGGRERVVTRLVTPGRCRRVPETRATPSGAITPSNAFFQVDLCRGRTSGQLRGELDYGAAIAQIAAALSSALPRALGAGPGAALNDLETAVRTATPEATIRLGGQWRRLEAEIAATARASIEEGPSARVTGRVSGPLGPVEVGVEASVERGPVEEERVVVTVGPARRRQEPDCYTCVCGRPTIEYTCAERPLPSEPKPPTRRQILRVPLFFEYETANPLDYAREGFSPETFDSTIAGIVDRIREGYTISRIEGRTSPEGPLRRRRRAGGRFEGNVPLAQARARAAEGRIQTALRAALPLAMRSRDRVGRALSGGYTVEGTAPGGGAGTAELFGEREGREVRNRGLREHLRERLRTPAEGKADPLALEHVIGESVPPEIRGAVEARVAAFRAKIDAGALTDADLETIFVPFRRALVVLEPPPPRRLTAEELQRATTAAAQAVAGNPVECSDEDRALFRNEAIPPNLLFEGECRAPGRSGAP